MEKDGKSDPSCGCAWCRAVTFQPWARTFSSSGNPASSFASPTQLPTFKTEHKLEDVVATCLPVTYRDIWAVIGYGGGAGVSGPKWISPGSTTLECPNSLPPQRPGTRSGRPDNGHPVPWQEALLGRSFICPGTQASDPGAPACMKPPWKVVALGHGLSAVCIGRAQVSSLEPPLDCCIRPT